ncbi:MAG TPA: hypothetical protein P5250_08230, partial [Bacteroidales bacterium]|nr:hypothetical protein [Bacteroidales bacterium]
MKNSFKNIRIPPLLMFMIFILVSKGGNGQTVTGFSGAASFEQNILYWDKFTASTPIGYEIYWQTSPGVTLSSNMIPSNGINVSLVHTGLTPGVTYYYAIRVVMAGPQYSLLSNEIAVTPLSPNNLFAGGVGDGHNAHLTCNMDMNGNVISVAPTGLSAAPAPGSNYIYWNFVPGATSYTLQWQQTLILPQ